MPAVTAPPARSWLDSVLAWWRAVPLIPVAALVAVMALPIWVMQAKEAERAEELYYPFSHFPMYSEFTDWDYVVYLADGTGQPLALEKVTQGVRVARTKKNFNSALNDALDDMEERTGDSPSKRDAPPELLAQAGDETLRWVVQQWRDRDPAGLARYPQLRLYRQGISFQDGKVRPEPAVLVAEWTADPSVPAPAAAPQSVPAPVPAA